MIRSKPNHVSTMDQREEDLLKKYCYPMMEKEAFKYFKYSDTSNKLFVFLWEILTKLDT